MIQVLSVHEHYTPLAKEIAHKIKGESISGTPISPKEYEYAISLAARDMAYLVPKGYTLVPIPSHQGYATATLDLAKRIASIAHVPYKDILKGKDRTSSYISKKNGETLADDDFGYHLTEECDKIIYIDNVIASGMTAKAAYNAHQGLFLTYVCMFPKGFTPYRGLHSNTFRSMAGRIKIAMP